MPLVLLLLSCADSDGTVADHDHPPDSTSASHEHELSEHEHAQEDHEHEHEHEAQDHSHEADFERYTDAEALAAVQNVDPWSDPSASNLEHLWHHHDRGYQWLTENRWTMDNRTDPPATGDRHELVQMFHETVECEDGILFDDCNSTAALKFYVNGPRITDNDWSEEGFRTAALRQYNTHASGIYLVSFGQNFIPSDHGYGVIAPSGIHLEPHGAHQALRIDGTGNSGENVRIDVMAGATGISVYGSETPGLYCEDLGYNCDETRLATFRGGILRLEDLSVERSSTDARNAGVYTVHDTSLGVEHFYSWHWDEDSGLPVHCTWNETVTEDSLIKLTPYSTSPDLLQSHSYVVVEVWGEGGAPDACIDAQSIKTDASGVYGYSFPSSVLAGAGFSVAILGPSEEPLDPGDWQEGDRPSFLYEVFESI